MHDQCIHIPHFPPLQLPSCVATRPNAKDLCQAMHVARCPMFVTGNSMLFIANTHPHLLHRSQPPAAKRFKTFYKGSSAELVSERYAVQAMPTVETNGYMLG